MARVDSHMVDVPTLAWLSLIGSILVLFGIAVRRENVAAAINAFAAFVLALLPVLVDVVFVSLLSRGDPSGWVLPVWVAGAGVLHSIGMLGLYESTWWWDHLTHGVSASLVAALVYAGFLVAIPAGGADGAGPTVVPFATVAFTLAIGGFWELIELVAHDLGDRLDIEPVLIHYGRWDTVMDLIFDVVGAVVVVAADVRVFVPVLDRIPTDTRALLVGTGGFVLVGGTVMALVVFAADSARSNSRSSGR